MPVKLKKQQKARGRQSRKYSGSASAETASRLTAVISGAALQDSNTVPVQSARRLDRLYHNLGSIHAHFVQLMESFLPISGVGGASVAISELETLLQSNSERAALLLFKLNKQVMALGTEITVYDMLQGDMKELDPHDTSLYGMVRNVASGFFSELTDNGSFIKIENSDKRAYFDFQTIEVALYYVIENAVKYILPRTNIRVSFEADNDFEIIRLRMESLYVRQDEVQRIFEDGYSGTESTKGGLNGKGIGMFQARRLVGLNNGSITFHAGKKVKDRRDGLCYADNAIIIKLPKALKQQY